MIIPHLYEVYDIFRSVITPVTLSMVDFPFVDATGEIACC